MRKISKKGLKNKCNRLWSEIIHLRDGDVCRYCGKVGRKTFAHHIFGKGGHPSLKFDVENGILLCYYCHNAIAHGRPYVFEDFMVKRKGQAWWDDMWLRANLPSDKDYEGTALVLKGALEKMKGDE